MNDKFTTFDLEIVAFAVLLSLIVAAAFANGTQRKEDRAYHPISIQDFCKENPAEWHKLRTHVLVEGFVTYVKREGDGDTHIRICDKPGVKGMDRQNCIVAECIPELPCTRPSVGDKVSVDGISRYDAERPGHHWWEVHPVEDLKILAVGSGQ